MFQNLEILPPDPILGLMQAFAQDDRPDKIDLGVGVYQDDSGRTPIMGAVLDAEARLLESEGSKSYLAPAGADAFNRGIQQLLLGDDSASRYGERLTSIQTPGGCGALRIGAELIQRSQPGTRVWVSDPTWANHMPLLGGAGLSIETFPYYDFAGHRLDFDAMMASLQRAGAGDMVLLHGCCHNPCGADLHLEQWRAVTDLALERGFTPFIDVAYQGLGAGLEEDAVGWRWMAERVPEMLIASSCSKNFGLYRERTGTLVMLAESGQAAMASKSQALSAARQSYSMPPSHGALIAGMILEDVALRAAWQSELEQMRGRIVQMREALVEQLGTDFGFIRQEYGMFSFLGISPEQLSRLREEYGIYMVDSTRINLAGLNAGNLAYFVGAMRAVL
jgi:aspartate aminotransferase